MVVSDIAIFEGPTQLDSEDVSCVVSSSEAIEPRNNVTFWLG